MCARTFLLSYSGQLRFQRYVVFVAVHTALYARGEIYERGKDKALRKSCALDLFPPDRQIRLSFSVYLSVRRRSNGEWPMLIWFPCSAITTLIADVTHITRIPARACVFHLTRLIVARYSICRLFLQRRRNVILTRRPRLSYVIYMITSARKKAWSTLWILYYTPRTSDLMKEICWTCQGFDLDPSHFLQKIICIYPYIFLFISYLS